LPGARVDLDKFSFSPRRRYGPRAVLDSGLRQLRGQSLNRLARQQHSTLQFEHAQRYVFKMQLRVALSNFVATQLLALCVEPLQQLPHSL